MKPVIRQPSDSDTRTSNRTEGLSSWKEAILALGPFLVLPVIFTAMLFLLPVQTDLNNVVYAKVFTLAIASMLLIALLISVIKSFPRWSFPYWGFTLLVTFYLLNFTGTMFGDQFRGSWLVWLPILTVIVMGLLWMRRLQPIYSLFHSIWQDWTLLSFAVYGALPLLFMAAYDEVHQSQPFQILIMLILAAGALFYMRSREIWPRFACLLTDFSLGWIILMVHQSIYWNGRQEIGMGAPATWAGTLNWTSRLGAVVLLYLAAPLLIWVFQKVINYPRPLKAG
jgi:hypothetical protein